MNLGLSHTLAIVGLGLTTFAIAPTHAQTTAPGPYYATPSWDQKLPASTRFIVLSNWDSAAVLDRETGLVWDRSPDTIPDSWQSARNICLDKNTGGRMGWRLPSVSELTSLLDRSVASGLRLPAGHPFNIGGVGVFWSMTSNAGLPNFAFVVRLTPIPGTDFFISNGSKTDFTVHLEYWCVRGGAVLDNY